MKLEVFDDSEYDMPEIEYDLPEIEFDIPEIESILLKIGREFVAENESGTRADSGRSRVPAGWSRFQACLVLRQGVFFPQNGSLFCETMYKSKYLAILIFFQFYLSFDFT